MLRMWLLWKRLVNLKYHISNNHEDKNTFATIAKKSEDHDLIKSIFEDIITDVVEHIEKFTF